MPLVWASWEELQELPSRRLDFHDSEEAARITLPSSRDMLRILTMVSESAHLNLGWIRVTVTLLTLKFLSANLFVLK